MSDLGIVRRKEHNVLGSLLDTQVLQRYVPADAPPDADLVKIIDLLPGSDVTDVVQLRQAPFRRLVSRFAVGVEGGRRVVVIEKKGRARVVVGSRIAEAMDALAGDEGLGTALEMSIDDNDKTPVGESRGLASLVDAASLLCVALENARVQILQPTDKTWLLADNGNLSCLRRVGVMENEETQRIEKVVVRLVSGRVLEVEKL